MDQDAAQRLRESADGQALIEHIKREMLALDSVSSIDKTTTEDVAAETIGRKRALETLARILQPLLPQPEIHSAPDRSEYAV